MENIKKTKHFEDMHISSFLSMRISLVNHAHELDNSYASFYKFMRMN